MDVVTTTTTTTEQRKIAGSINTNYDCMDMNMIIDVVQVDG